MDGHKRIHISTTISQGFYDKLKEHGIKLSQAMARGAKSWIDQAEGVTVPAAALEERIVKLQQIITAETMRSRELEERLEAYNTKSI